VGYAHTQEHRSVCARRAHALRAHSSRIGGGPTPVLRDVSYQLTSLPFPPLNPVVSVRGQAVGPTGLELGFRPQARAGQENREETGP
jgi:hypothetical protein